MSELANKVRALRGDLTAEQAGKKCGVSRESFYRFERGGTTTLATLRKIAEGFRLNKAQWTDLLVSWLKLEAGEDQERVWIEPREGVSELHDEDSGKVARAAMLFEQLNPADREEVLKAMQRPEVRACLPAINQVWEKFEASRQLTLALPPQPHGEPRELALLNETPPPNSSPGVEAAKQIVSAAAGAARGAATEPHTPEKPVKYTTRPASKQKPKPGPEA